MYNTATTIAEQCYFGEVNLGHGLLSTSFEDKGLLAFLSRVTDMPVNKPADIYPEPFYGCHTYEGWMIFTKTFMDRQSSRSGMVFTHAIIIQKEACPVLNDLAEVFLQFVTEVPNTKQTALSPISIPNTVGVIALDEKDKILLSPVLHFLVSAKENEYLVISQSQLMPALYINLWNAIIPTFRQLLSFRLSFSPTDIQPADYGLYFTPSILLSRWPKQVQHDTFKSTDNSLSIAAKILLQLDKGAEFGLFLRELNFIPKKIKDLQISELAFTNYSQLQDISTSKLLQLLRLIVVLSPTESGGLAIKQTIADTLLDHFSRAQVDSFLLLSMANIELKALAISPTLLISKINPILASWWASENLESLHEILQRRIETLDISWWTSAIDTGFEQLLNRISSQDARLIWKLWGHADVPAEYLWNFFKADNVAEPKFIESLPGGLDNRLLLSLLPLVKRQRWLQLHATLLTLHSSPAKALEEQIALTNIDKPSLTIIAKIFAPIDFIQNAIASKNSVLLEIALELPVSIDEIAQTMNIIEPEWQEFILGKIYLATKQKQNINEFEPIVDILLDALVDDKYVREDILSALAKTKFADLSNNKRRPQIWAKLQSGARREFLIATGKSLLEHLTTVAELEPTLRDSMLSLNIVGDYMHSNAKNWSNILRIFELFPSLPERYLSDHLNYSSQIDGSANSVRLGNLVDRNNWRDCAFIIYEKARSNNSFQPALSRCMGLLGFWEKMKLKYFSPTISETWSMTGTEWLSNFEALCNEIYDEETEIRIIWKKAGGDTSDLLNRESARVIWHKALNDMKKGKVKGLTFKQLIQEMMANAPAKHEKLQMLLNALRDITTIR